MASLACSSGFIGAVRDPQTGELVQLDSSVPNEQAERLAAEYAHLEVTGVTSNPTNEDGEYLCVGKDDGQCSRTVDEPGGTCWQHLDES